MRRLAFALFLFGCGSNDSSTITAGQAKADCDAFLAAHFCPKAVACIPNLTQAECVAAAQSSIDCSTATGENGKLSLCESQLDSTPCSVFYDMPSMTTNGPASCMHVFLHP